MFIFVPEKFIKTYNSYFQINLKCQGNEKTSPLIILMAIWHNPVRISNFRTSQVLQDLVTQWCQIGKANSKLKWGRELTHISQHMVLNLWSSQIWIQLKASLQQMWIINYIRSQNYQMFHQLMIQFQFINHMIIRNWFSNLMQESKTVIDNQNQLFNQISLLKKSDQSNKRC